jgi:ABC-type thiamin/hydroxymethylpyrimidine transport system permease subunit
MWLGIAALMAGVASGVLERIFYGYVDENNVLQESFFLPLAFILVFLGGAMIVAAIARNLSKRFRDPSD